MLDPSLRAAYLHSLALVRELDFDVGVQWGPRVRAPTYALVDEQQMHTNVDKISTRVEAGSLH